MNKLLRSPKSPKNSTFVKDNNFNLSPGNFLNSQIFGNNNSFLQNQINPDNNPTNFKGKLNKMQDMSKLISEELEIHEKERKNLSNQKDFLEKILMTKLDESNVALSNEIDRLKNEAYRFMAHENAETSRLKNHENTLRHEVEILKSRNLALQNRIEELEKNLGSNDHNFGTTLSQYPTDLLKTEKNA